MNRRFQFPILGLIAVLIVSTATRLLAQDGVPETTATWQETGTQESMPRVVQFSGVLQDGTGRALTGVQGATFALYREQLGGAPLWLETQNVQADGEGKYTVQLGAAREDGLPLDLFSANEARWLGVQSNLPGEIEQPRVMLVSVPYALKAGDAETLGGKPLSAFVMSDKGASDKDGPPRAAATDQLPTSALQTSGYIPKFDTSPPALTNSVLAESSSKIGIGTDSPGRVLHIKSGTPVIRLEDTNFTTSFWELQQSAFFNDYFGFLRYENGSAVESESMVISNSGRMGLGTGGPTSKLDIRTAENTIPGLAIRAHSGLTADLQQWQDSSGNVLARMSPTGLFVGPPGMVLTHATFSQANGYDSGTASFLAGDGAMEAQTGTTNNSVDDTVGGVLDVTDLSIMSGTNTIATGLDRSGAFVSARARWKSSINSNHVFYILAGGTATSGALSSNGAKNGFGFKAEGTALKGVTINGASESTTSSLATLYNGTFVDLLAIRRGLVVQFYVNGALSSSTLSTNLPSNAGSLYEVRTGNGSSGSNAVLQVAALTAGIPF